MPDYRTLFDAKWIKSWDLGGKPITVTIAKVEAGTIENHKAKKSDRMPVLWFRGAKKPFGCNKTNAKTIASIYGNKTEDWVGKPITMYPTRTMFGGEEMDCIRIKPDAPKGGAVDMPNPEPPAEREPGSDDGDDDEKGAA